MSAENEEDPARRVVARARSLGRRSGLLWAAVAVLVVAAVVIVIVVLTKKSDRPASEADAVSATTPPAAIAVGDSPPPWPAPLDATAAARAAGLPMLSSEGMVEHIHVHLDVLVDGKPVAVPANIGIDAVRRGISPLHTHDDSGVIHIESPVKRQFSIGEFFTEWGVSLSADNIGGLRATDGRTVRAYVNGQLRTGDPAAITFNQHDEIALIYGAPQPTETPPATYQFPPGD
jgi:hypothetical protein